jgi:hypothetical protein
LPVQLYFDHNVNQAVIHGLRLRGLDVLTAFEDGAHQFSDPDLLDRATMLGLDRRDDRDLRSARSRRLL